MTNSEKRVYLEERAQKSLEDVEMITTPSEELSDCDFAVYTQNGGTVIYCPIESFFEMAVDRYFSEGEFGRAVSYTSDRVYYSDFGAVGDGKTEDIEALRQAHTYANTRNRHTVCANPGDKYYIEKTECRPIEIATDADWTGAEFIIDDRFLTDEEESGPERSSWVFLVIPEHSVTYTKENDPFGMIMRINERGGIKADDTEIPLDLGYDAIVALINTEKSMYMRWAPTGTSGKGGPQQEVIVVRADNSLDLSTRPLFDYAGVDKLIISRCDTPTVTLKGGRFTTIATRADMHWNMVNRAFIISRSNVVIDGMDHYVENQPLGEPCQKMLSNYGVPLHVSSGGGPNYNGFIFTNMANNIVVKNTKLCGRVHYNNGSYDIGGKFTNKIVFQNCSQYNMYDENGKLYHENYAYWGIHGTNYCKNIEFIDCELSRFDAHAGVYNVRILGCRLGKINAVGGGTLTIEDTTVLNERGVILRQDYASSWRGDIIFKNVVLDTQSVGTGQDSLVWGIIHNSFFGFHTQVPNVIVDNVSFLNSIDEVCVYRFYTDDSFYDENALKHNVIIPAERVIIRNQKPEYKIKKIAFDERIQLYKEVIEL